MAGLLGDTEVSPLTLGLLQAGSSLMSGGRRGLAQAPMAFASGLMQGQEAIRARQAQALREQMLRQQMDMQREQLGIQREDAGLRRQRAEIELGQVRSAEEARAAERERVARVGEWIRQNRPDLEQAFSLNPAAVMQHLLPKERAPIKLSPGDRLYEPETFRELAAAPEKAPAPTELSRLVSEMNALPPNDPMRAVYQAAINRTTTHPPGTSVRVENKMSDSLSGKVGELVIESRQRAVSSMKTIETADRIDQALSTDKAFLGPGATIRTNVARFATAAGAAGADTEERLRSTRRIVQGLAQIGVAAREQLRGQGSITEQEGAALAKAESGDIDSLTGGELRDLLSVARKAARINLEIHQSNIEAMRASPATLPQIPFYRVPGMDETLLRLQSAAPPSSAPAPAAPTRPPVRRYDQQGNPLR